MAPDGGVDLVNLGLSGETVQQVSTDTTNTGGPYGNGVDLSAMVSFIANSPVGVMPVISFWEGTNDLNGGTTGAALLGYYESVINYVRSHASKPFKMLCFTEIDRYIFDGPGVVYETNQNIFNAGLRANYSAYCDALYDLGANPHLGCSGCAATFPNLYFQDAAHPTVYAHANEIAPAWIPIVLGL
jgi:hypothetical protein